MDKKTLRSIVLNQRINTDVEQILEKSSRICANLLKVLSELNYETIALYSSFRKEVDLSEVFHSIRKDKKVVFPFITDKKMIFRRADSEKDFRLGKFGIMEPMGEEEKKIDLFILPAVAFDRNFYRLGYGGGYYDRYFSENLKTVLIGSVFDFQIVQDVFHEEHDVQADMIVSESGVLRRKKAEKKDEIKGGESR